MPAQSPKEELRMWFDMRDHYREQGCPELVQTATDAINDLIKDFVRESQKAKRSQQDQPSKRSTMS